LGRCRGLFVEHLLLGKPPDTPRARAARFDAAGAKDVFQIADQGQVRADERIGIDFEQNRPRPDPRNSMKTGVLPRLCARRGLICCTTSRYGASDPT